MTSTLRQSERELEVRIFEPAAYVLMTGRNAEQEFDHSLALDEYGTVLGGHKPPLEFEKLGWWLMGYQFGSLRPLIELFRQGVEGSLDPIAGLEFLKEGVVKTILFNKELEKRAKEDPNFQPRFRTFSEIETICHMVLIDHVDVQEALERFGVTPRTINELDKGRVFSVSEVQALVNVAGMERDDIREEDANPFMTVVARQLLNPEELNAIPVGERSINAAIRRNERGEPFSVGSYVVLTDKDDPRHGQLAVCAAQGQALFVRPDIRLSQWEADKLKKDYTFLLEPNVAQDVVSNLGQIRLQAAAARMGYALSDLDNKGVAYFARDKQRRRVFPDHCLPKEVAEAFAAMRDESRANYQERQNRVANLHSRKTGGGDAHAQKGGQRQGLKGGPRYTK